MKKKHIKKHVFWNDHLAVSGASFAKGSRTTTSGSTSRSRSNNQFQLEIVAALPKVTSLAYVNSQEIVRIKLAIAIANAKGSAVDFSDTWTSKTWGCWPFLASVAGFVLIPDWLRNLRRTMRKVSRQLQSFSQLRVWEVQKQIGMAVWGWLQSCENRLRSWRLPFSFWIWAFQMSFYQMFFSSGRAPDVCFRRPCATPAWRRRRLTRGSANWKPKLARCAAIG